MTESDYPPMRREDGPQEPVDPDELEGETHPDEGEDE